MSELTLGITNIGDLLLRHKLTNSSLKEDDVKITIPPYQRPYKWTAKNANQLVDDIMEAKLANKAVYRVGTLILHRDSQGNYYVVDGLQRTITFSLLLKALGEPEVDFLKQKMKFNKFNVYNIANNYRALERRVKNLDDGDTDTIKKSFCRYVKESCEMIVVITDDQTAAFQFFDSQNARGKKLYPHDLLKAFHLREMTDRETNETEKTVRIWEDLNQERLASLFQDYLYRIKEWVKGNKSVALTEHNLEMFKGVTRIDNYPYAKYFKGAYAYADTMNNSALPFVTGLMKTNPFQLNTPIVAGKPFFEYAKHYYDILADIQNSSKYEGYLLNDNGIIKTLNLPDNKNDSKNNIPRVLFDTAVLLYVDRFCPEVPQKGDCDMLDQFVNYAFIWAFSLRAQYDKLRWDSAQNYIIGINSDSKKNAFNIYQIIIDADSPIGLLNTLADAVQPIKHKDVMRLIGTDQEDEFGAYVEVNDEIVRRYMGFHFIELKYEIKDEANEK